METKSRRPTNRECAISLLNAAIKFVNIVEKIPSIPVHVAALIVNALLTMVKDQIANEVKYVKVGSEGADNRREPDRVSTNGEEPDGLGQLVRDAINQLTATAEKIQKAIEESKWDSAPPFPDAKEEIAAWKSDLDRILRAFNAYCETHQGAELPLQQWLQYVVRACRDKLPTAKL